MGCASSNPLITGGKNLFENAKESANDVLNKGEQTMHDVGQTAKDGIVTGLENVKGAMESAVQTAENSVGGVMSKISDTLTNKTSQISENASDHLNATKDNMMEAVSEAETVLASEMDAGKDAILDSMDTANDKMDSMRNSFGETVKEVKEPIADLLEIEDIEQSMQIIDNNIGDGQKQMNDAYNTMTSSAPIEIPLHTPDTEVKMEEPVPTLWEIAADLIVEKKETAIKLMAMPIEEVLLHKEIVSEISPAILQGKLAEKFLSSTSESDEILYSASQDTLHKIDEIEDMESIEKPLIPIENVRLSECKSANLELVENHKNLTKRKKSKTKVKIEMDIEKIELADKLEAEKIESCDSSDVTPKKVTAVKQTNFSGSSKRQSDISSSEKRQKNSSGSSRRQYHV